jgi:hypothetical protein
MMPEGLFSSIALNLSISRMLASGDNFQQAGNPTG